MRKTIKILFTLLFASIYCCCGHYSEKNNANLSQENNDLDFRQVFFENGRIKLETNYVNEIKHGYVKGYYENGNVQYTGWYTDGEKDSIWHWYYDTDTDNEVVKVIEKWEKGKQVSHQKLFYDNGSIQTYVFCDPLGNPVYKREYNKEGFVLEEEGLKSPHIVIVTTNESVHEFSSNDTLTARIYHIIPPETEAKLFVRVEGLQDDWQMVAPSGIYEPILFSTLLSEVGNYKLEVKLKLKDKQKSSKITEYINQVKFVVW